MKAGAAAVTLLLALAAGAAQARDADPVAVGRYHLRKGNQLAGEDHCHSAIHEYTLAYQKLKDPVVLFNRGECYRRIGQAERAVSDYRAFLEAVPGAPNRVEIEAKIAALTPSLKPPAPLGTSASPRAPTRRPGEPASNSAALAQPPPEPPPAPVLEAPPPARVVLPPVVLDRPSAMTPEATTHDRDQPEEQDHHGHTWIWIALGAAVAGGAVGAYFALRPPTTTPPVTDLGNYKF